MCPTTFVTKALLRLLQSVRVLGCLPLFIREIHAARGQKAAPTTNATYSISRDYIVAQNLCSVDSGFYDWHFL